MEIDRGLLIVAGLPLLLALGPWVASIGLIAAAAGSVPGLGCFSADERRQISGMAGSYWLQLRKRFDRGRLAAR
jgi:hypothetical protein